MKYYSDEKNVQVLVALLKAHGIRKVIASPGATNVTFVGSLQCDPYFEIYSCVDERSAAYMATGLAAESGEPVVITCTGATASRNYLSALTEAFYRKLPIIAVTSTQMVGKIGHLHAQVIDRSSMQNDVVKLSVNLPLIKDDFDKWDCEIKVNKALLESTRNGGGPVHINLPTTYSKNFDVKELPECRVVRRITAFDSYPQLPKGRIGIFIGSHKPISERLSNAIDKFCEANNGVVFCDHTSSYKGRYRVLYTLVAAQNSRLVSYPDLLVHIGEITGDSYCLKIKGKEVWRVNEDGEIRDTYMRLSKVFQMPEEVFFEYYAKSETISDNSYLTECKGHVAEINSKIPELPFSNLWVASKLSNKLPNNSVLHFGILNSLRSWNFFEIPQSVSSFCNVGGFGIDGCVSSLIGASFVNKDKLYFGVVGDLAFFYDLNSLGNRHIGNNIRLLIINNGIGIEFKNFNHPASRFGSDADLYMAGGGHFGKQSMRLIKNYAIDLGFDYISAASKEEFEMQYEKYIDPILQDKPLIFEVFTNDEDESKALELMHNLDHSVAGVAKNIAKQVLPENAISGLKNLFNR